MGTTWIAGALRYLKKKTSQQGLILIIRTVYRKFRIKMAGTGFLAAKKLYPCDPPSPFDFQYRFPLFLRRNNPQMEFLRGGGVAWVQKFCNPNSPAQKSWPGCLAFLLSIVILN